MGRSRNLLRWGTVLAVALLAGCQGNTEGSGGTRARVSVEGLAAKADEVGPDGADTCPLPYDFANAVSAAEITGETGPGPAPGGVDEPPATAENGLEAEEGAPFALNPGALVSCWFHIGGRSLEVHLVATRKPLPEVLLSPVILEAGGEDVDALKAYFHVTGEAEPGRPVLGKTGDYATVRVEAEGRGGAALLVTPGDAGGGRLRGERLSALGRALYEQIVRPGAVPAPQS
ncbi:hypothetical protein [Streptomyces sp. B1I3]|uniref:hypothetical protein n=1 Tax=Streptomyces sp. B1I3 TaxID=3042264 RepID=UPI0027811911|nr:hypothetical protein [Streptomyces sp. B1I3]MDQ0793632.1 hypothetical protein [Streptomyces sp. B1I3]